MTSRSKPRMPGLWDGVRWAMRPEAAGGGTSRKRLLWRALNATLWHGKAMRRWLGMVFELRQRDIIRDIPGEYLRAVRPYVHRGTGYSQRVTQLVDHMDWLESAFHGAAFAQIASGEPLILAELTAPRGYDHMRLQLQQAPAQSTEGELLLTLVLQRSDVVQQKSIPIEAGALALSRFRIDGTPCLVIGGVRGQRNPVQRISTMEMSQALHGWKPSVLLVRVAQELARFWNLSLIGMDPSSHRLQGWTYRAFRRYRETGDRIFASYRALWDHFLAGNGPHGWLIVPLESDEKLAATALSPEKRSRQTRRADYWIRMRNLLRSQFRKLLQRPSREPRLSHITQALTPSGNIPLDEFDRDESDGMDSEDMIPSRVLETGPGSLL